MLYDIIMQNNASREFSILQDLDDKSETPLYFRFEDVVLDVPDGEYTYALVPNDRDDVTYDPKTPILDTIVHTNEGDVVLRFIKPYTGLLRVGNVEEMNIYDEGHMEYPYDDNNDNIYYEG